MMDLDKLPSLGNPPRLAIPAMGELYRVTCPHCLIGFCDVVAVRRRDVVEIEGIRDPRTCGTCGRKFRLKPRVQLLGVTMEE